MTTVHPSRQPRERVTVLFAAALDGDPHAEDELRELAIQEDRAADALLAFACTATVDIASPADVAAIDQMIAAVLDILGTAPHA